MFGGLEMKGSSASAGSASAGNNGDASKQENKDSSAKTSASSFSFLNSQSASAAAPAPAPAPAASGFSFMGAESSEATPGAPAAVAASGFSFLAKDSAAAATAAASEEVANATSGFSFVTGSGAQPAPAPAAASSGFDFLTSTSAAPAQPAEEIATRESTSPAPSELTMASTDFLAASNNPPLSRTASVATPGVSFAAPTPAAKPKKKRNRATKVGVHKDSGLPPRVLGGMVNTTPPTIMESSASTSSSIPDPSPPTASTTTSTRDEALEASRRAEDFLNQKLKSEISHAADVPGIETTKSEDDMIAAAKAAAEEAQNMNQTPKRGGFGNRIGGLFRKNSAGQPESIPEPAATASERLQREQESSQRAMAERQLKMMNDTSTAATSSIDQPEEAEAVALSSPSFQPPVPTTASCQPPVPKSASFQPPKPTGPLTTPNLATKQHNGPKLTMEPSYRKPLTSMASAVKTTTPAPKPRKQRTPTDDFHDMMRDFHNQVVRTMEQVSVLRNQRGGLLQERFVTVAKERYAEQQKTRAETQLQEAAEQEDFELAAAMDTEIQSHERERFEYQSILDNINSALKQLDDQKGQLVENVTSCFQAIQTKLKDFQKDQESKDTASSKEALARFSNVAKQLSTENDRLQQDLKHLERDAKLVADEREELEASISEQAGEYEKMRDTARDKLGQVEQEIENLRALLADKMKEASKLRTDAAGHDEAVLRVRVKFSRQLTRVQKKEGTVRDNQEEWALESEAYEKSKSEHDAEVEAHSEALLAHEKLLDALNREVDTAVTFEAIVAKEIGFEVSEQRDSDMDDELAQMQAEVVKCEAAVSEAKSAAKTSAKELSGLETEKCALEAQLPQLEELKKAAAAKRDFKAAGQASKDVKEATARLAIVNEDLAGGARQRKEQAEQELTKLEQGLEEKRKVAHSREKESGLKAMRSLADNIKRLMATKEKVCGNSEDHSIQAVGAHVLDGQITALKLEGQTHGDKYGGWDQFAAEFGGDSSEKPTDQEIEPAESEEPTAQADEAPKIADAITEKPESPPQTSKEEQMRSFGKLSSELKQVEVELEAAVEKEDFEKAAELQETLERLMADVGKLDLTDAEMELALSSGSGEDADVAETEIVEEIVELKDSAVATETHSSEPIATTPSTASGESGDAAISSDPSVDEASASVDNKSATASMSASTATSAVATAPATEVAEKRDSDADDDDI